MAGCLARALHPTPCCLDVIRRVAEASFGERCRTRLVRARDNMRRALDGSGQTATLDEVKDGRAPRKPGRRLSGAKQVQHATLLCANPQNRRRKRAERRGRSRFSDLRESVRSQAHHFQIARPERKRRCCTKRVASNRGAHRGGPRARAKADKIERPEAARICDPKLSALHLFDRWLPMLPNDDDSWCRFAQFKLLAHFLDLRCLRFETCREGLNLLLLLRDGSLKIRFLLSYGRFLFLID